MKTIRRTNAQIIAEGQALCAKWYANARNRVPVHCPLHGWLPPEECAVYWQLGAAAHYVKVQHRMNILEECLAGCYYAQQRRAVL